MTVAVYIGLDGGASKTAGVALDEGGRVLARHRDGGAWVPPDEPPTETACATLRQAAEALCQRAGKELADVRWIGIGLNGIDFPDRHAQQHAGVAAGCGFAGDRLTLVNDGIVALWGASGAPGAALLQHGSAFTGAFRDRHGNETLFDNLGGGRTFDVRWELNVVVSRMLDGRVEPTGLLQGILDHYGVTAGQFPELMFRRLLPADKARTATAVLYRAWLEGDAAAAGLMEQAAADYALAAWAMLRRAGEGAGEAVFGGGVIARMPREFWGLLTRCVQARCPRAAVKGPDMPPEYGAAVMAAFADGAEPQAFFAKVRESFRAGGQS